MTSPPDQRRAPILFTSRMLLHRLTGDDLGPLHAIFVEPGVRRYLWDDETIPRAQMRSVLATSDDCFERHGVGLWAVRAMHGAEMIGCCGFHPFHRPSRLELLVALRESCWGRGLAGELLAVLIRHAFEDHGFEQVLASTDVPNQASLRVMEKLGMRRRTPFGADEDGGTVFAELTRVRSDSRSNARFGPSTGAERLW